MKHNTIAIAAAVAASAAAVSLPAAGGGATTYEITWSSIDSGGGTSSNGSYTLVGVIGQPDAGTHAGGVYTLNGGFLAGIGDDPEPCPGDVNGDGDVGLPDLLIMLSLWGTDDAASDIAPPGGDGEVGFADLVSLLSAWGPCL